MKSIMTVKEAIWPGTIGFGGYITRIDTTSLSKLYYSCCSHVQALDEHPLLRFVIERQIQADLDSLKIDSGFVLVENYYFCSLKRHQ